MPANNIVKWITVGGRHIPIGNIGKFNPTSKGNSGKNKVQENKSASLSNKDFRTIKTKYNVNLRKTNTGKEYATLKNKQTQKIDFIYNTDKQITFSIGKNYIKTTGKEVINKLKEK